MKPAIFILLLAVIVAGCKKPYNPHPVKGVPHILVVEGVINPGSDVSDIMSIRLTRTVNTTSAPGTVSPVLGAIVTVESDNGNGLNLIEGNQGYYYFQATSLDLKHNYRLRIKTVADSDSKANEYVSDFVPVKITPPIDSIGFTIENAGLQVYANAHDATNNTKYYRWDYEETWQFHSEYYSYFYSDGSGINYRPLNQQIYYCFGDDVSSDIVLGSSAKLQQDVIYKDPIAFIPSTSLKLQTRYSILLHQYALTPDAFSFWITLRKNTEQLGSIFDVLPSNINGNIHSVINPKEPVIGYISACTVQSKRVFISSSRFPQSWSPAYPQCIQDTFLLADKNGQDATRALIPLPPSELITSGLLKNGVGIGYLGADAQCVDCTLTGFTQVPSFWQY